MGFQLKKLRAVAQLVFRLHKNSAKRRKSFNGTSSADFSQTWDIESIAVTLGASDGGDLWHFNFACFVDRSTWCLMVGKSIFMICYLLSHVKLKSSAKAGKVSFLANPKAIESEIKTSIFYFNFSSSRFSECVAVCGEEAEEGKMAEKRKQIANWMENFCCLFMLRSRCMEGEKRVRKSLLLITNRKRISNWLFSWRNKKNLLALHTPELNSRNPASR